MEESTIDMTHAAAEVQVKACLNRVRIGLRDYKPEAYNPRSVSLGCFHYGSFHSREYELNESKCKNFPGSKLPNRDDELNKLSRKIIEVHGKDIREWYGPDQNNDYWSDRELGTNMAQDGLFLLQFLCQAYPKAATSRKAARYISHIQPILEVEEDIMKLENQIPLFVLKTVIEWEAQTYQWILKGDHVLKSILRRAVWHKLSPFASPFASREVLHVNYKSHLLEFVYDNIIAGFKPVSTGNSKRHQVCKRRQVCKRHQSLSHQVYSLSHQVLGFVYKKFLGFESGFESGNDKRIDLPRVEQLHERGVKFAQQKGLDLYVSFDRKTCTLKLPVIKMADRTDAVMRNLLAFEDMKNAEKPVKNAEKPLLCYVKMMDSLIDTAEDVQLLRKEGIIRSGLGSEQQVADTWNEMTQGLEETASYGPIDSVIDEVVTFYTSKYRILWAEFKQKYFSKPWLVLALIGGCFSLLLSFAQTILAWEQVRLQQETMK